MDSSIRRHVSPPFQSSCMCHSLDPEMRHDRGGYKHTYIHQKERRERDRQRERGRRRRVLTVMARDWVVNVGILTLRLTAKSFIMSIIRRFMSKQNAVIEMTYTTRATTAAAAAINATALRTRCALWREPRRAKAPDPSKFTQERKRSNK